MRNNKGQFTKGNPGKPKGAKSKTPDRELLIELIDTIVNDLATNYEKLRTSDKIRILQHFNHLYKADEELDASEARVFNILFSDADIKKAFNE